MVDMMPSFPHAVAAPSLAALGDGVNHMAKGQKRSNREAKKPKSTKKKPAPARSTITTAAPKKP
jgi:hypothetical protein